MVSQSHIDDPAHWRNRAKVMRQLAIQITRLDDKRKMLAMAESYDRLAERAEDRAKGI
jgi:hypothetical protein